MFAGELPGKQPRRGRVGGRGHVGAVAQVLPQQGGNGLGHVEPVRAELEPGGAVGAGGIGRAQRGDSAGLLAVEHNKAADEAVAGCERAWRESGLGAPADIDTLKQQNLTLEQHIVDLRLQLDERDQDLAAARAANRELMAQLNATARPR